MNHDISNDLTENSIKPELPRSPKKKKIRLVILGVILLAGLGFLGIYTGAAKSDKAEKSGRNKQQVTPVTVAMVTQKTVPIQLQAIGNVQSGSTVSITPEASGRIIGVYFKKGQDVKKGQLLFTLDDRSQAAAIQQAQGIVVKDQAQVQQARATLARDLGQVDQARATLIKDQALVRQAQATLAKDQAQAQFAKGQSDRYSTLYKKGAISLDQAQQYVSNSKSATATLQADREAIANAEAVLKSDRVALTNAGAVVKGDQAAIANAQAVVVSDQGALDNAKVQLSYAKIYAPIDGRAGNVSVTQGNVVQANSSASLTQGNALQSNSTSGTTSSTTSLVTITQIRPIEVAFSIPETNLPQVQKYMHNGKLKVDVTFPNSQGHPTPGVLTSVNNTVDNTTGTIQLIGQFDNAQGNLFPGQFVNATLTLTEEPNATVVPSQAVQNGPDGQFVFVVKPDMTVQNVPVTVSNTIDGLDVIQKGPQPGDKIVTDGQANLVSGSKIRIKTGRNDSNAGENSSKSRRGRGGESPKSGGGES
ncbi:efflux RND transporter periplasmic adaptor subunit [Nostoc sp. 'Lobaria pulmonaria (5183) cyanobiont']|uniref:efflux RND transporter periplasmic adaptor subunit n=1 Tax=Nostoc sp. 'Lobaria pulmonaria (5183) cyanobiont' TaxID=1618022 RepID=UPI000CF33BA3|nr:efflux RND transporter periplasmic adaptor subunit [Nostoc sp. 'Lobaria pulmonaria (5183) cyanobiont']AVH69779.1 RND family efflux transporter MFP subunit [Nostoc sp. 'Lobaria pulmonaria (5183) cyanobiont']